MLILRLSNKYIAGRKSCVCVSNLFVFVTNYIIINVETFKNFNLEFIFMEFVDSGRYSASLRCFGGTGAEIFFKTEVVVCR